MRKPYQRLRYAEIYAGEHLPFDTDLAKMGARFLISERICEGLKRKNAVDSGTERTARQACGKNPVEAPVTMRGLSCS